MDELLKELEALSNHKKKELLKETLKNKRKELNYLIAKKNCYYKQNDYVQFDEIREKIKSLKKQLNYLQQLKNDMDISLEQPSKSNYKPKKEKQIEIILSEKEIILLNKIIDEDHFSILTNFDEINVPLLEHLLLLKQKYQFYLKKENKNIKNINKSITLLNDLATVPKKTYEQLNEHKEMKKVLNKIIKYLDKLLHLEYKKINKLNREQKRLTETLFAEKHGIKEALADKPYTIEELYSVYYQLVFKDKDLSYVEKLLEEFPDLYLLKSKKRLFYQDILDRYENVLLNKNYLGITKKEMDAKKELEYYQNLILKYLSYSFENDENYIIAITIRKIERILDLMTKNDFYLEKSKVILEQLSYLKEIIKLGNLEANENTNITEVKGEYIFSIDNRDAKIIEDALSIEKDKNEYHINFYTPDVVSFIEPSSILEKKVFERFKQNRKKEYALPKDNAQFFKLIQGRRKRVVGYHFIIDENGNLKDLRIEKNVIKLYNTYSFEDFNNLLNEGEDKNAILLKELYCLLENKDSKEYIHSSNILKALILDFGTILGKYLDVKNIPCIYKNLENGTLSSIPTSDYYVEFTSPLRSYISIMNQRILLDNKEAKNIEEKCAELNKEKCKVKVGGCSYEN